MSLTTMKTSDLATEGIHVSISSFLFKPHSMDTSKAKKLNDITFPN